MGVFERPKGSGIWWVLFYADGKRHREKVGTKENAKKLYTKRKGQALAGQKMPELNRRRVTIAELADDAVAYATEHAADPRNYVTYAAKLKSAMGSAVADQVSLAELEAWIRSRKVSGATQNRYKAFLSLMFREGMRHGKIETNPAKLIPRKRESTGRKRFLSHEEYEAVLGQLKSLVRRAAVTIAAFTGMRLSEQFTLTWRQIDFRRGEIHLERTKNGDDRSIPINSRVLAALESLRDPLQKNSELVFPRKFAGTKAIQPRWFGVAAAAAGVEDFTWHGLRHTFCSWHAMAGTPIKTIQELAGHKTISMSARYSHLTPSHKATEQERIVPTKKVVEMPKRRKA